MSRRLRAPWAALLLLLPLLGVTACGGGAAASTTGASSGGSSASSYFHGKTITMIIPYNPGGGYDITSRLVAPYLGKVLGATMHLVNDAGGGGIVGANAIAAARSDGLTIGIVGGGQIMAQILKQPGVSYDLTKMKWLGRPLAAPTFWLTNPHGPVPTFADVLAKYRHGTTPLRVLSRGPGASDYGNFSGILTVLHIPFRIIPGYSGAGELNTGLLRGDGDIIEGGWGPDSGLIAAKKVSPVLQIASTRFKGLPNTPTDVQVAQQAGVASAGMQVVKALNAVGDSNQAFVAPAGVPAARIAALVAALKKVLADPGFQAKVKKARDVIDYAGPQTLTHDVQLVRAAGAKIAPYFRKKH